MRSTALPIVILAACASSPRPPQERPRPAASVAPIDGVAPSAGVLREAPLRDGRSIALREDGALTLGRGDVVEARAAVREPAGCALRPWGARGIALCPNGSDVIADASAPLLQLGGAMAELIPGREGRTLTRNGPCAAGAGHDAARESVACTWSEGRGWRTWSVDRADARVLDVHDQRALVRWTERVEIPERPPLAHEVVGLYDIDNARWIPMEAPDPTARWVCAGFDAEGRVCAIVHTGTVAAPRAWRLTGEGSWGGHRTLQSRPLPFPAEDFGALDDLRMVLVRGAEVAATRDSERAIPVRLPEGLSAPGRRGATRCGERVACGGDRCVVDGRVTVPLPAARDPLAP